jgi:hypothetical protein
MSNANNSRTEIHAEVDMNEMKTLTGGQIGAQDLSGNGFTYRHDWGNLKGRINLNLAWDAIQQGSKVFVSATEFGGGNQDAFIGAARYTVHNVAPHAGGVSVQINVEWDSPIRVRLDYLIVNP